MPAKTFTSRRYWHNTLLVIWVTPFLVLIGMILLAMNGTFAGLIVAGVLTLIGSVIALARDISDRCFYMFKDERLVLVGSRSRKDIPIEDLIDASLVDRVAARDYIRQRAEAAKLSGRARREMIKEMLRYCSVDIGLSTMTFGVGRGLIDRLPMAKYDLVLLRSRNQGDMVLSPRYSQDLVETVSRFISARTD